MIPGLCDAHTHISWPLDFVFDHPEIAAMPDDEHALEVAGVVRTYLRWGYTLLVGAGALKPRVDVIVQRAIDKGLIDGPRLLAVGRDDHPAGRDRRRHPARGRRRRGDAPGRRRAVRARRPVVKLMASGDGIVPGHPSQVTYMDDAMVGRRRRRGRARTAPSSPPTPAAPRAVRMCGAQRRADRPPRHLPRRRRRHRLAAARDDVWVCPGLHYLRPDGRGQRRALRHHPESIEAALYPEELQAPLDGFRKLHGNGVRIVAGGDFGHQWTRHGTYAAELAAYVELVGLSPLEALLTATANAGPLVGERLGQIERGLPRRPRGRRRRPDRRRPRSCSTPTASARWSRAAARSPSPAGTASTAWARSRA